MTINLNINREETTMDKQEAREYGIGVGTDIAEENIDELSMSLFFRGMHVDDLHGEISLIEMEHFRQFTPFEFYAKEWNESDDPDAMWKAYESGVDYGITNVIEAKKKEVLGFLYKEPEND